jgi:hypothetical protein
MSAAPVETACDEDRLEVDMARHTLADVHRDEGALAANRRTLLNQLRLRFESLPPNMEQVIQATNDAEKLAEWLRGVVIAPDLASIGIPEGHSLENHKFRAR